jgi:MoaA/NifB/PqqE/SkfB family radical SAM enzyme
MDNIIASPQRKRQRRKMRRSQYVDPDWTRTTEPRLNLIKNQLERLLQIVELEKDGEPVEVDGFRLKNLNDWLIPIQNDINAILSEVASPCDLSCDFCYLKGLPPAESYGRMRTYQDLSTKIRYFSPDDGTMLFQMLNQVEEHLRHPQIFEILAQLRKISDKRLEIITNGSVLDEEFVARLAEFKPMTISVSLNAAQPENRKSLMRDRNGQTAINSLPLLRKYGIPFRVGIVPWTTISFEDIIETVRYADENEALIVRVGFPGYTRFFPLRDEIIFDRNTYWTEIVEKLWPLALEMETPLVFIPYLLSVNRV